MKKPVTAQKAYAAYIETKSKPAPKPVVKINSCPDCNGTGKQGKHTCYTCGGEKNEN